MLKRRPAAGAALAGAVAALVLAAPASAAVVNQLYSAPAGPAKQFKKQRGAVSFTNVVDTVYNVPPAVNYTPPATRTVLSFDGDFRFDPGRLPDCNVASLVGKDATAARSACPRSVVGQGSAAIQTQTGVTIPAAVTAFNGFPSGGNPVILLHTDAAGVPTKPILTGVLRGRTLDVTVPVTPGTVIDYFDTTINKVVSKRTQNRKAIKKCKKVKNKRKRGKCVKKAKMKKIKTFYASARCSDGAWNHSGTTFFLGGGTQTDTFNQSCQQKNKRLIKKCKKVKNEKKRKKCLKKARRR